MPCGLEGNRGMVSQTSVVLHLRAQGLGEGDEHPPMLSLMEYGKLYLIYVFCLCKHLTAVNFLIKNGGLR